METRNSAEGYLPSDIKEEMTAKKIWKEECPVHLDRLRIVKFTYYDFNGKEHYDGEVVTLDAAYKHVAAIFEELKDIKFPLAKAHRIDYYNGDDEASMADNNTSCFNCREITGGGLPSLHSYGLAIDINPIQNPYISLQEGKNNRQGFAKVLPAEGLNFLNRTNKRPGMTETENIREIFKKHGFSIWGGQWNTPIDWQHFQVPRAAAQLLAIMNPEDAEVLFEMSTKVPEFFNKIDPKNNEFVTLYKTSPSRFKELLQTQPNFLSMDHKTS